MASVSKAEAEGRDNIVHGVAAALPASTEIDRQQILLKRRRKEFPQITAIVSLRRSHVWTSHYMWHRMLCCVKKQGSFKKHPYRYSLKIGVCKYPTSPERPPTQPGPPSGSLPVWQRCTCPRRAHQHSSSGGHQICDVISGGLDTAAGGACAVDSFKCLSVATHWNGLPSDDNRDAASDHQDSCKPVQTARWVPTPFLRLRSPLRFLCQQAGAAWYDYGDCLLK